MESKGLNINSFHKNQRLLDAINQLLITYKLYSLEIPAREEKDKIQSSKKLLLAFLGELENLIIKVERKEEEPLIGADVRLRNFAKSFVEAKGRVSKFNSSLFKSDFTLVKSMLAQDQPENIPDLVQSLSELRILLEEQISIDSKSIINDI